MSTNNPPADCKDKLHLNLRNQDRDNQKLILENRKSVIGSHEDCTVVLKGAAVQPVHCMIINGQAGTVVRNFHPDTRINGRIAKDQFLNVGNTLSVGSVELTVEDENASQQRNVDTPQTIDSRADDLCLLIDRLTRMETVVDHLKNANETSRNRTKKLVRSIRNRMQEAESTLTNRLENVEELEEKNQKLEEKLEQIARESISEEDLKSVTNEFAEKNSELVNELSRKEKSIEQFASKNSELESELRELRNQSVSPSEPANEEQSSRLNNPSAAEMDQDSFSEIENIQLDEFVGLNKPEPCSADENHEAPESAIEQSELTENLNSQENEFPADDADQTELEQQSELDQIKPADRQYDLSKIFAYDQRKASEAASFPEQENETNSLEQTVESELEQQTESPASNDVPFDPFQTLSLIDEARSESKIDQTIVSDSADLTSVSESDESPSLTDNQAESVDSDTAVDQDKQKELEELRANLAKLMQEKIGDSPESQSDAVGSEFESSDSPNDAFDGELTEESKPAAVEFKFNLPESNFPSFNETESANSEEADHPEETNIDSTSLDFTETFDENASDVDSVEGSNDFAEHIRSDDSTNPYASFTSNAESEAIENESIAEESIDKGSFDSEPMDSAFPETPIKSEPVPEAKVDDSTGLTTSFLFQQMIDADEASSRTTEDTTSNPATTSTPFDSKAFLEASTDSTSEASSETSEEDAEDNYIKEYMQRLIGGGNKEEEKTTEEKEKESKEPSLLEKTFEREIKERQELLKPCDFKPKSKAPEKSSNLQAMRELANQTAKCAIEVSSRKRKFQQQSSTILIASGACFFVGACSAMMIKTVLSIATFGSVVFFALAGMGAWHFFELKNNAENHKNENNEPEKNQPTSANPEVDLEASTSVEMENVTLSDGTDSISEMPS